MKCKTPKLGVSLYINTSDWNILKGERIPRFPSKIGEKRKVIVDYSSWKGLSVGAKHNYVKVMEENNQWWCEDENAWVEIYTDSEKSGYSLKAEVMTEKEAKEVAKFFVQLIGGKGMKNHYVEGL